MKLDSKDQIVQIVSFVDLYVSFQTLLFQQEQLVPHLYTALLVVVYIHIGQLVMKLQHLVT